MKLEGKVALVTGSGKGLGRAIALAFAEEGADIAVNARHRETADEVANAISSEYKRKAISVIADVADSGKVDAMVDKVLDEFGRIDILVNNAGIAPEVVPTIEQSVENWDKVIGIHLRGTYLCSRRVGQWLVKQNSGVVLNMASINGFGGFCMRTSYGPAKAAIINLTQALAIEWAKHNIRVNCVAPAYIETPLSAESFKSGAVDFDAILRRTPMGRMGRPEEVAKAAVFLVSDDSSYITGVTLPIDGGWLAQRNA